jgi:hypothetical protein
VSGGRNRPPSVLSRTGGAVFYGLRPTYVATPPRSPALPGSTAFPARISSRPMTASPAPASLA